MRTSAVLVSVLNLAASITVIRHTDFVQAGERHSIGSLEITCSLNDILIIAAPETKTELVLYYLTRPSGDSSKLNITKQNCFDKYELRYEVNTRPKRPTVTRRIHYEIVKPNSIDKHKQHKPPDDVIGKKLSSINSNEFLIGPLLPEDHGNWILSVFLHDDRTMGWLEYFLVISVTIVEETPALLEPEAIKEGNDFNLSFAYPITEVETCELTPPAATFERNFKRKSLNSCSYLISNATVNDTGRWKITGVGRIVYAAEVDLKVLE